MKLIHFNRERYFSFDLDEATDKYYLSIPVSNSRIDYEEYYEVSKEMVDRYPDNIDEIERLVLKCRLGKMFHLSLHPRAPDRGSLMYPLVQKN